MIARKKRAKSAAKVSAGKSRTLTLRMGPQLSAELDKVMAATGSKTASGCIEHLIIRWLELVADRDDARAKEAFYGTELSRMHGDMQGCIRGLKSMSGSLLGLSKKLAKPVAKYSKKVNQAHGVDRGWDDDADFEDEY